MYRQGWDLLLSTLVLWLTGRRSRGSQLLSERKRQDQWGKLEFKDFPVFCSILWFTSTWITHLVFLEHVLPSLKPSVDAHASRTIRNTLSSDKIVFIDPPHWGSGGGWGGTPREHGASQQETISKNSLWDWGWWCGIWGRFQVSRALLCVGCVGNLARGNSMTGCLNESYLEIQRNKVGLKL